jgi:hypothetical protein
MILTSVEIRFLTFYLEGVKESYKTRVRGLRTDRTKNPSTQSTKALLLAARSAKSISWLPVPNSLKKNLEKLVNFYTLGIQDAGSIPAISTSEKAGSVFRYFRLFHL